MTAKPTGVCPTCRGTAVRDGKKLFPFCSARCQLVDLGRWLGEEYRIPDEADHMGGGVESVAPGRDDE